MTNVLVVDDEKMIRYAFEQFLKDEGYEPLIASTAEDALSIIKGNNAPDIIFLDYRLPGKDGLELLEEIRVINTEISVVFMTAFGAMDVAVKAMHAGAYEYLVKPLDLDKIGTLIKRIRENKKSLDKFTQSSEIGLPRSAPDQIVGTGPSMNEIFKMIGILSGQDVTVLITGESGVGKELVARAIHTNGPRRNAPFIAVNCGAVPENLIESEMFGYEKGAFTGADRQKQGKFEAAGNGTIFLDEIGELQMSLQVKLLRVLQEQSFERVGGNDSIASNARIIAASNKDLLLETKNNRFRKDLFYRLHLVNIQIPPLRERREDIPSLIDHFIRVSNIDMNRNVRGVTEKAMEKLKSWYWPGNVRELENMIKRAMVLCRDDVLPDYLFETDIELLNKNNHSYEDDLARAIEQYFVMHKDSPDPNGNIYDSATAVMEKTLIKEALKVTGGNQMHAARVLGMNRSTLRKKISNYSLQEE